MFAWLFGQKRDPTDTPDDSSRPPVSWIGSEPWRYRDAPDRRRKTYTDARLYILEFEHEFEPEDPQLLAAKDGVYALQDVHGFIVSAEHQTTTLKMPPTGEPGPTGTIAEINELLSRTPDVAAYLNPGHWPVCCQHLSTLIAVNPDQAELGTLENEAGSLDDLWWPGFAAPDPQTCDITWNAELKAIRKGKRVSEGLHVFHCQTCGSLYGEYSHT